MRMRMGMNVALESLESFIIEKDLSRKYIELLLSQFPLFIIFLSAKNFEVYVLFKWSKLQCF